jgi:hypothetical protein
MGRAPLQTMPHQLHQIVPPPPPPPEPVSQEAISTYLQFQADIAQLIQPPPGNNAFTLTAPTASQAACALYQLILSITSDTTIVNVPAGVEIQNGTISNLMAPTAMRHFNMLAPRCLAPLMSSMH